jgi:hypothetical protein
MLTYSEAKQALIKELCRDAEAHEASRHEQVGAAFDEFDYQLPRGQGPEFDKLFIALHFWDGWIDARNHNWLYYDGINESDWPVLARRIIWSLEIDEEITDPVVLDHFDFRKRDNSKGLIRRLFERWWK